MRGLTFDHAFTATRERKELADISSQPSIYRRLGYRGTSAFNQRVGWLHLGNGIWPSHRWLSVDGLEVILTEQVLQMPTQKSLRSSLDIWMLNGRKVFSASRASLKIGTFHAGEWADTLIEIAIQRGIAMTESNRP